MYQLLFVALLFLTGCDEALVLGVEDANVSEKKLYESALALDRSEDYREAATQYENFVGLFPFSSKKSDADLRLMKVYDHLGNYDDLDSFSEELTQGLSPTPESFYYFAKANFRLARSEIFNMISEDVGGQDLIRLEKAKVAYEKLLSMKNVSSDMTQKAKKEHKKVCEMIAENHFQIGQFYLNKGHEKVAKLRFQQIQTLYPNTEVAKNLAKNQRNLTKKVG
jgi:outer membrane protein assembly factor BamD (BamD/ComL family)